MSRIINRQRQLAEQGRLRLGYTVPAKTKDGRDTIRPVRSETWIVTSHSHEHVETAANLWGGTVEEWEPMGNGAKQWRVITEAKAIPAILPPGDPLTQAYEMWSKGGAQRRCDGGTESFTGNPCLCLAQFGETWFELGPRDVCVSKSRLKVLLPDMPGLGSWRMETGSYYATDEIAGMVDTIRGAIGDQVLVPVTLRIEPRTRVAKGQTKQFVVPVLELRGVTAGALLSGEASRSGAMVLNDPTKTPHELEAKSHPDYRGMAEVAPDLNTIRAIWKEAADHDHLDDDLKAYLTDRGNALQAPAADAPPPGPVPDKDGVVDAEIVPDSDADAIWNQILKVGGQQGLGLSELTDHFSSRMGGMIPDDATAEDLTRYLEILEGGVAA